MTLEDLTRTLENRGFALYARAGRLQIHGEPERLTPDLEALLSRHARQLAFRLDLYRHLHRGERVMTPAGPGAVLQVFAHRVTVHLDETGWAESFEPEAVTKHESEVVKC